MRKSNVLALAIVGVLIAVLLVVWMLASKPAGGSANESTATAKPDEAATNPESGADLESTSASSRSDVGANREQEGAQSASSKPALRIQVLYASGLDEHPEGLDVGVSNRMGTLFKPRHVAPNEYLLVEEPPDLYIVAAKARGFRPAVTRAQLSAKSPETKATITLIPERSVVVRWRSDDGRPIKVSIADAKQFSESVLLEVYATKFRVSDVRPFDRHALALLRSEIVFDESEPGARIAHEKRVEWAKPEPIDARASTDTFGTLNLEEDGAIWASAYCGGVCVASLPVQPGQKVVEFITSLGELQQQHGTVKLVVVDAATGQPLEGAVLGIVQRDGSWTSHTDGVLICESVPPGLQFGILKADDHVGTTRSFEMPMGGTVDLGTIRLETVATEASFRVVDGNGAVISGVHFELVNLDESARVTPPGLSKTFAISSDQDAGGNLHFGAVERARYLLRSAGERLDSAPRIVEPSELRVPPNKTAIAEIVVRSAGVASFVLEPPFAKGTQVIVESIAGHPLRELDVDQYGVAATDLLAGPYRLHLIEYGRATSSIDVSVDSNPFVFEIHR